MFIIITSESRSGALCTSLYNVSRQTTSANNIVVNIITSSHITSSSDNPPLFRCSFCLCVFQSPEDTVTSSSPTPFVSPRGIFDKTYPSPSHHRIIKRAREWPCAPPSMRLPLPAGKLLSGMTAMVFGLDLYSCACCSQVAVTWIFTHAGNLCPSPLRALVSIQTNVSPFSLPLIFRETPIDIVR